MRMREIAWHVESRHIYVGLEYMYKNPFIILGARKGTKRISETNIYNDMHEYI